MHSRLFIGTLFIIVKYRELPIYPSVVDWLTNLYPHNRRQTSGKKGEDDLFIVTFLGFIFR